jgi:hypothetical protein
MVPPQVAGQSVVYFPFDFEGAPLAIGQGLYISEIAGGVSARIGGGLNYSLS